MTVARYFNPRLRARLLAGEEPGWLQRHIRRPYIIMAVMSMASWADRDAITALRKEAKRRTQETGIKHVVDHEIPLCHPYVCGLTVETNMRVIPHAVNAAKGNKWHPDQMEFIYGSKDSSYA